MFSIHNYLHRNMEIQVLFGILFSIFLIEVDSEDRVWSKEEDDCAIELKLDKAVMQALNKQNITPEHNSDLNNFLGCYWEKNGKMNSVGEINWQLIDDILVKEFQKEYQEESELTTVLAEEMVLHAAADCRDDNIYGNSHGQTVVKLKNCIKKKIQTAIDNFEKTTELSHKLFVKLF